MRGYALKALEDEVLEALKEGLGEGVKTLKTHRGDWQEGLKEQAWRLPAVLVMHTGTRADQVGAASYDLTLDLRLLVIVRELRGEEVGRQEAGGAYEMLAGIREALWHQDLGLDLLPLALVKEEPLKSGPDLTVFAAHYRTSLVQDF